MKSSTRAYGVPIVFCALLAATAAQAKEHAVDRSALPAPVEQTVQHISQGATIKGFSTERENGKTVFEAQLMVDGHSKDVQIAPDGAVNEVEEEVPFTSLPAEVQSALKAKTPGATITKVESLTKRDKLVAYEAATLLSGKKGEVQVGPHGEKLAHEE